MKNLLNKNLGRLLPLINSSVTALYKRSISTNTNSWWSKYSWSGNIPMLLTKPSLELFVRNFIKFLENLNVKTTTGFIINIGYSDGSIKSLCRMQFINVSSPDASVQILELIKVLMSFYDYYIDNYQDSEISSISIRYRILSESTEWKFNKPVSSKSDSSLIKLGNNLIPNTMDIESWPSILGTGNEKVLYFNNHQSASLIIRGILYNFIFHPDNDSYTCTVGINGTNLYDFTDTKEQGSFNLDTFLREFNSKITWYVDGVPVQTEKDLKSRFMTKINKLKDNFDLSKILHRHIVLDLETYIDPSGVMQAYTAAWYMEVKSKITKKNISKSQTYLITDYDNIDKMFLKIMEDLINLVREFKGEYFVLVHNLSGFDGVYLARVLAPYKPSVTKSGSQNKIISFEIPIPDANGKVIGKLIFKDSLKMLPASLRSLAKSFRTTLKGNFDFKLLDFRGRIFTKSSLTAPAPLALAYNLQDCKVLYKIWTKFQKLILQLFKLNVNKYLTISSLAMGIFRSNFLNPLVTKINLTPYETDRQIRSGYKGGHVDMYKPYAQNIFCYDVNSLYPFVMLNNLFPVGETTYFEGIRLLQELFGILYVDIVAPADLKVPVLLHKVNGVNIAPLGSWSGWYFSEELKFAESLGYKITVQKGYLYDKGNIFSGYIDKIYNLRLLFPKGNALNLIAKMLLNSLSGRFGLNLDGISSKIVKLSELKTLELIKSAINIEDFGNGYGLLSSLEAKNTNLMETFTPALTSTPVAIAIAAYGRMHINKYKILYADDLLYSDTDSLFLTRPLPDSEISDKILGKFKLEHLAIGGVFLGPKFYGLLLPNGKEIIKIRGFKLKQGLTAEEGGVTFSMLTDLLKEGNYIELYQEKWLRNREEGFITIKDSIFTAMLTENKRTLIVGNDGWITGTKSITIDQ